MKSVLDKRDVLKVGHEVGPALQPCILEVVVVCLSGQCRADNQVAVQAVEVAPQAYLPGKAVYFH